MNNRINHLLKQSRPLVMGILNATPDSFSDGGQFIELPDAMKHVAQMVSEGADIIDVGGESTRPGAQPVSAENELQRVIPVIENIVKEFDVAISIDTSKPEVMRAAVQAGAHMVNDVNALRADTATQVCAELAVPVCLMHMQGEPRVMQNNPQYENVVDDIVVFFQQRMACCVQSGIDKQNIILDPGFGFGKSLAHNLSLLKHLDAFHSLTRPLLIGISRKSMLGTILESQVDERLFASVSAAVLAYTKGASIFRVHDVKATVDALKVCMAVSNSE